VELGQVHPPGVLARDADQLPDHLAVEHAALKDERAWPTTRTAISSGDVPLVQPGTAIGRAWRGLNGEPAR